MLIRNGESLRSHKSHKKDGHTIIFFFFSLQSLEKQLVDLELEPYIAPQKETNENFISLFLAQMVTTNWTKSPLSLLFQLVCNWKK